MFELMKKALVAGAVVAVGAFAAPAMASAAAWDVDGTPAGSAPGISAVGGGDLSFTVNIGVPVTTTCYVDVSANLWNGTSGEGEVTGFDPDEGSCTVSGVPFCAVSNVSANTPYDITTSGSSVTISSVDFTNTYVNNGGTCALAGNRQIHGSVTGTWSNVDHTIAFSNASGLTAVGVGAAIVNGEAYLEEASGGNIFLR